MKPIHYVLIGAIAMILTSGIGGLVGYGLKRCEVCTTQVTDSLQGVVNLMDSVSKEFQRERNNLQAELDAIQGAEKPISKQTSDAFTLIYGASPDSIANIMLTGPTQPTW